MSDAHLDALQRMHREALIAQHDARAVAYDEAVRALEARVARDPADPDGWIALARTHRAHESNDAALEALRTGVARARPDRRLWRRYLRDALEAGWIEEAQALLDRTRATFPHDAEFRLWELLAYPAVFDDALAVRRANARLAAGLAALDPDAPEWAAFPPATLADAVSRVGLYYRDYLGDDTRALHSRWGDFLAELRRREARPPLAPPPERTRLRIGLIGDIFCDHVAGRLFLSWAQAIDRTRFEVRGYAMQERHDTTTDAWAACCDRFVHDTDESVIEAAIRDDAPDLLLYPCVGMSSIGFRMAALRLAPVQVVGWGHPITTGLPTMDWFLSAALPEPAKGDAHYRERLHRLSGLGVRVSLPRRARALEIWRREDFGVAPGETAYVCAQHLSKFGPDFDEVLVHIATAVPGARFLFLAGAFLGWSRFRARVAGRFRAAGLDWSRHEVALPRLSEIEFDNLLRVGDAQLDPIGWTGGHTTINAIACGLPVITTSGPTFRTCQSVAILSQFGETRTIADSADAYVALAVRIATDAEWRTSLRASLEDPAKRAQLCDATTLARELNDFLARIASGLE